MTDDAETDVTSSGTPATLALGWTRANFVPLTPTSFLARAAKIHPDRIAIVHGRIRRSYREFDQRARRLASALAARGIRRGDVVSAMLPNVPAMLEAHFGVPLTGGVLNTINTRLDTATVAYILAHAESKILLTDREFSRVVGPALAELPQGRRPLVIEVEDDLYQGPGEALGEITYERFIAAGDPRFAGVRPEQESDPIALNYTSGTTGRPKGVLYHHRGAYLASLGQIAGWPLPPAARYLWTLPMFHCNGWCFTWAVTAVGGTHLCLRRVDPAEIFRLIAEEKATHFCGAPTVMSMLINAPANARRSFEHDVALQTAGSAPSETVLRGLSALGFKVMHIYGMTELHGVSTSSEVKDGWEAMAEDDRIASLKRQGVPYHVVEEQIVANPESCEPVPADAHAVGEILFRSNTVMLGYLKDEAATAAAIKGGYLHSGDVGVEHPDGYIEIRDRSKDIIISGGENISSIEIENAICKHPAVLLAAVVARPDDFWGETPCAFVQLKPGETATSDDILAVCRAGIASFKVPKTVVFGELPTTATGKIQKYTLRERAREL